MIELLEASPEVAKGMDCLVLQPMSGFEELRKWLYESNYHVIEDRLMAVGHRWYQLICVCKADGPDPWPQGFPQNCWLVGYRSFADRDRQLGDYCEEQLKKRRIQLRQAMGTTGEDRLAREIGQLEQIIKEIHEWN